MALRGVLWLALRHSRSLRPPASEHLNLYAHHVARDTPSVTVAESRIVSRCPSRWHRRLLLYAPTVANCPDNCPDRALGEALVGQIARQACASPACAAWAPVGSSSPRASAAAPRPAMVRGSWCASGSCMARGRLGRLGQGVSACRARLIRLQYRSSRPQYRHVVVQASDDSSACLRKPPDTRHAADTSTAVTASAAAIPLLTSPTAGMSADDDLIICIAVALCHGKLMLGAATRSALQPAPPHRWRRGVTEPHRPSDAAARHSPLTFTNKHTNTDPCQRYLGRRGPRAPSRRAVL